MCEMNYKTTLASYSFGDFSTKISNPTIFFPFKVPLGQNFLFLNFSEQPFLLSLNWGER